MSLAKDMDNWWWGGDEDVYLDPEGKPISKEDYEKQFEGQVKMPVEPDQPEDLPEQPQFVGDPTQFKPMPFDPTNPMMYMGSGSPFYHLRGGAVPVKMAQPAYYKEHRDIVKLLENTGRSLLNEAKDQKNEATATAKKLKAPNPFYHLRGGAIDKYIAMAKEFAKRAGYKDWNSLRRADDGEHKLELRGVKFGRKGYGDFIKYSLDEGVDEAQKHRDAYLARATNIKGDWAKDMYSPNSLAINILWDGKSSCPMSGGGKKSEAELQEMSVVKLIDYGKSLGVKGLDGKTKSVIIDKILKHIPTEVVAEEKTFIADPDYPEQEEIERILRNSKEETVKEVVETASLEELKELAKELGVERILHKTKRQLAEEAVDILMDKKRKEYEDEGRLPRRWTGSRDPNGNPVVKVGHFIRKATKAELKAGHPLITEAQKRENDARERDAIEARKMSEEADRRALEGKGRAYTAEEWEQKLCKGENSLLAQKKQKIKEREAKRKKAPAKQKESEEERVKRARELFAPKKPKTPLEEKKEMRDRTIESLKKHEAEADRLYKEINDDSWGFSPEGARQKRALKNEWSEEVAIIDRLKREIARWNEAIRNAEVKGSGKPVLPPQDVLEGKKDNPVVEETIEEPMDDGDIRQYLPNAKIMRYSALAKLSDIEQLLPKDKSYVVLLYENTPGSGHWVALMRYGKTIEFFCSYGSKIDAPLSWQNPKDNAMLGQSRPFLSILLNKAKDRFRAIYNPVAYQSKKQGVATCGAWDVMRINQLINHNQDLHEFHDYMESVKKETGLTYDEIVVNYVSKR
jgi:hypothetical protein